jgi:hypothetical protein
MPFSDSYAVPVSSDGDDQQVLVALAHRQGIDAATLDGIAKSAQRIGSDGDKARVLMELTGTNIEPVRDDFFAAANTISSAGDQYPAHIPIGRNTGCRLNRRDRHRCGGSGLVEQSRQNLRAFGWRLSIGYVRDCAAPWKQLTTVDSCRSGLDPCLRRTHTREDESQNRNIS